ncbi:MAG: transglycosylase domain-containing protein [Smithella sp.]|nr:transglycosylase domain-containing protein [Smithella sp.]
MGLIKHLLHNIVLLVSAPELRELERKLDTLKRRLSGMRETERPPEVLVEMLIAGEDHRFKFHCGVDFVAICRAVWRTAACGRREGASTIEMQLVRVLTGRYEKKLSRKIREALLAVYTCQLASKSEIALMYLLVGYYGTGMDGFEFATKRLGFRPHTMSPREAASLAARLKYPEPRSLSVRRMSQISTRTNYILSRHLQYFKTSKTNTALLRGSHATV